jgi:hypothetical protein
MCLFVYCLSPYWKGTRTFAHAVPFSGTLCSLTLVVLSPSLPWVSLSTGSCWLPSQACHPDRAAKEGQDVGEALLGSHRTHGSAHPAWLNCWELWVQGRLCIQDLCSRDSVVRVVRLGAGWSR